MIKNLFLEVINMSITASVVILAVIALRWLFRKLPKIYSYLLWSMVLFRLLCPYSFSLDTSAFNLLPAKQTEKGRIEYTVPEVFVENIMPQQETDFLPEVVISPQISTNEDVYVPQAEEQSQNIIVMAPRQKIDYVNIFALLWLAGVLYMIADNLISLYEIKLMLANSQKLYGNVYKSDVITTAFIIGVISPKIYLPKNLSEEQQRYIIFHEETHLKRKDYLFKYIGFIALALHWFNPLAWLAYYMAEKDMEMSCDEAVIKWIGSEEKRGYSQTLLSLSMPFREYRAMHLAFGEGETKQRIVNVLNFKKPDVKYVMATSLVILLAAAVLISNPAGLNAYDLLGETEVYEYVVVSDNNHFELSGGIAYIGREELQQLKIEETEEYKDHNGDPFIFMNTANGNLMLNFNEDCTKLWFTGENYENSGKVYNVKKPQQIKGFIDSNTVDKRSYGIVNEIILPTYQHTDCIWCNEREAFMVGVSLPEGWYFYASDVTPDGAAAMVPYAHDSIHIINDMNETVGAINFLAPEMVAGYMYSAEALMDYLYYASGYVFDTTQYKVWPNYGEIALASFSYGGDTYKNYSALAYRTGLEYVVFMSFIPDKVNWEQAQSIASSIDIQTADGNIIRASNLSYWMKSDEPENVMADNAVTVHLKDYQPQGYTVNDIQYTRAGETADFEYTKQLFKDYDYVVKVDFTDKTGTRKTNFLYIDKTDDTDYSILGYVEKTDKQPLTDYTMTVQRLRKVLPGLKVEKDNTLTLGTSKTVTEGESGLNLEKVTQIYHNGMVISEQTDSTVVLKESQPEIVKQGALWNGVPINGGTGKLIWPTATGRVSRGFVDQYPQHNGLDIAAPVGTDIYAADSGVVTAAFYKKVGYGVYCIIDHGGYQTLYGQCSELLVEMGQEVKQGDIIARVGSTGNSTGPHLHFEVKKGDVRYNPYDWF